MKTQAFLLSALFLIAGSPGAHENDGGNKPGEPGSGRVLGTISFPTSTTSAAAQQAFIQGMLLLHLMATCNRAGRKRHWNCSRQLSPKPGPRTGRRKTA